VGREGSAKARVLFFEETCLPHVDRTLPKQTCAVTSDLKTSRLEDCYYKLSDLLTDSLRGRYSQRHTMTFPPTCTQADWAVGRATSLPEVWAIVAGHLGLVGAWRLMLVCRAARAGTKESMAKLPRLVVCGGVQEAVGL